MNGFRISASVTGPLVPSVAGRSTGLPSLDAEFTGRVADLALLADALRTSPVTVVSGLAGIGKTTLVLKAARGFGGKTLFVDLDETTALPLLLAGLGVPQEEIPAEPAVQEVRYRAQLDSESAPVLVVLDNATSAAQVRPLLPGSGRHRVLVTSRYTLAEVNARLVELDVLPVTEAVELVSAALVSRRPDDARVPTAELVELVGRLPLALTIVAAVLADDVTLPVHELISLLRPPADRLDELDGVRQAFDLSYSRLTAAEQRLFRLLSVVPVGEVSVGHACALLDAKTGTARKLLASLRRAHLVEHGRARGRYRMHDLLRLHSSEQPDPEREKAWDRLVAHVVELSEEASGQHDRTAVEWLDLEWPLVTAVVERCFDLGQHVRAVELTRGVSPFMHLRTGWPEWARLYERALVSAQAAGDRQAEGSLHGSAGNLHSQRNDLAAAQQHYSAAVKIWHELDDVAGLISTNYNLALLTWKTGNLRAARAALIELLDVYTTLGDDDSAAATLFSLGCIAHEQNDLLKAYDYLTTAWPMFEALGNRRAVGMVLNMMGQVLTANGRHEVALSTFQKAIRCARESGDVLLAAQATANSGLIRMWAEDVDRAVAIFRESVELFAQAGEEDEVGKITQIIADLEQRQPR